MKSDTRTSGGGRAKEKDFQSLVPLTPCVTAGPFPQGRISFSLVCALTGEVRRRLEDVGMPVQLLLKFNMGEFYLEKQ